MGRLVAMVCNDPDRVRCVLAPLQTQLVAAPDTEARPRGFDAWGIGLYQGGEVLLKRRPQPTLGPVDFHTIAGELRTDTFIAHARAATVGDNRNENTHPFRFRSWLFAHHGTLPGFGPSSGTTDPARPSSSQQALTEALLAEIPDFLRRNLRGQTDSELLFHLFLTRLHEVGQLDVAEVRLQDAQAVLRTTVARLDETLRARGLDPQPLGTLALANGRYLIGAARGARLWVVETPGIRDCMVCRERGPDGRARPVDHEHLRAVLLISDLTEAPSPPFRLVDDDRVVSVARELTVNESPLSGTP
jgi:predicted glutamine amidotransferase